jgi:glycosyltransferase involved in cell wall biosynthesis
MTTLTALDVPISLIGHPFAPIGRGEDLRCAYRALKAVGISPHVVSVYDDGSADRQLDSEFQSDVRATSAGGVDIFCINGDEVEPVLSRLGPRRRPARYSIVIPQWELSKFPEPWARQLERFDEVWAPSTFIREAIAPVIARPTIVVPGSTGVKIEEFLGRRYFGIPESACAFLFAFDLRSYHQRKNPLAVLDAYARVVRARPSHDLVLVLKMSGADVRPDAAAVVRRRLRDGIANLGLGRVVVIERGLTDTETKNLVRCCDCFVSLHRGEGFGRFLAEAMLLRKPVIATAYSGNMEFMTPEVACLVNFRLVPVGEDEYPFWKGQVWADPNVDEAVTWMTRLVDDPAWGGQLGRRASAHIRSRYSYRAVGLRYLARLHEIVGRAAVASETGGPGANASPSVGAQDGT